MSMPTIALALQCLQRLNYLSPATAISRLYTRGAEYNTLTMKKYLRRKGDVPLGTMRCSPFRKRTSCSF